MKPSPFTYHRANSIDDAIAHLKGGDAIVRPLAGGQSLVPMLNLRLAPADKLVDLTRIVALRQTEERPDGIRYGALVTHAAFEDRQVPDASNGLMPFVGSQIAYRAVRTRGTIGGAIALADPAADWLTTIIALEADVIDPSPSQSATAVLDKISGAGLIRARQQQARLQFLTGIVEQLLIDNKRSRDTETAVMNMQLNRLRDGRAANTALLAGAGDALRTWKQP